MMPLLKKGAVLPQPDWPGIETGRLVARRLGAHQEGETVLLGHPCDLWVSRQGDRR